MHFNLFMYPTIPATDEERNSTRRPVGRDNELYQQMIAEIREITIFAEELGFDSIAMSEHHFHSEGWEVSPQPLMMMTDLAARTSRIKFLTLGLVTPSWDPVRMAEQTALLDHLSGGRFLCGVARGYQARAVSTLGQKNHTTSTRSDGGEDDQRNRRVHEDVMEILLKAWKDDLLQHDGEFYSVPPEGGYPDWPTANVTAAQGVPGEVDSEGRLQGISVVPKPLQQPHPKLYQSFSLSPSTMVYTAERDIQPLLLQSEPSAYVSLCELYQKVANENGRDYKLGQNVGTLRSFVFGDSREHAMEIFRRSQFKMWHDWFAEFGFFEAMRKPEDLEKYPEGTLLPPHEWTPERMCDIGYGVIGTKDDVKRQVEDIVTVHGKGEIETVSWLFDQGLLPLDEAKFQMETFAEVIISEYGSEALQPAASGPP